MALTRKQLIAKMVDRDLYTALRMFDGQPAGSEIELEKHKFTREQIGAALYRRGRIVPAWQANEQ